MQMTRTVTRNVAISVAVGTAFAGLTLGLGKLSVISENSFAGGAQHLVVVLLLPGMLGAAAAANNAHAWYLWAAAAVNWLVYFAITWMGLSLAGRLLRARA